MSVNTEKAVGRAILVKEWLKLKGALTVLGILVVLLLLWFWWSLDVAFHQTEPQAMLWYHVAHLGEKPYSVLIWFYLLTASVVAACQALPEIVRNRIRILVHLPVPIARMVRLHLFVGAVAVIVVNIIAGGGVSLLVAAWYPAPVAIAAWNEALVLLLPALLWYLGLWAVIVECHPGLRLVKFVPVATATLLAVKDKVHVTDAWIPVALVIIAVMVCDSFLSTKGQRLKNTGYRAGVIGLYSVTAVLGVHFYQDNYIFDREDYYLFYSPVHNTFVYQHNLGGHRFRYGSTAAEFTRADYEAALPFVFWRDLEIMGKLPIEIGGRLFHSDDIREYRLSIPYHPRDLVPPPLELYPLFNPSSNRGILPFPNQAFALKDSGLAIYNGEYHSTAADPDLTVQINSALTAAGIVPPLVRVWGRTTSMKPYDWGYFIKDSRGDIYNLRRADDRISVIPVVTGKDIVHMQMAENRQMEIYGFAIAADSTLYTIRYPDFALTQVALDGFDYTRMRFQILRDPLYYLIRYDDGTNYHAVVFDQDWQPQASTVFK